jgi:hypothetical protein
VIDVRVGEQDAADLGNLAPVRPVAIPLPEIGLVAPEVVTVQSLERRQELHAEVVAQAEGGPAGLHELLEVAGDGTETGAEVEQPGGAIPREQDAVAADLAGGAAEDGDGYGRGHVDMSWALKSTIEPWSRDSVDP